MATSVVADVLVLVVGVAVVNESLASRSRRQWRGVADYALTELSGSCRHTWITLSEAIGFADRGRMSRDELRTVILAEDGAARVVELAAARAADRDSCGELGGVVTQLAMGTRTALATWAPVLVETPYAAALNRYVEFQALLSALDLVLWEQATGKRPNPGEPQGPEWISRRIDDVIRSGAGLELELYPEAAEMAVRAPHGPGPRATLPG
jgi:hypothetical protein